MTVHSNFGACQKLPRKDTLAIARTTWDANAACDPIDIDEATGDDTSTAAAHATGGAARQSSVARITIARIEDILPLNYEALLFEVRSHPVAKIALQFHSIRGR